MPTYLKRLFGRRQGHGTDVSPAGRFDLYRSLDFRPVYRDDAQPGTLVFVLPAVARGSGGIADVVHLGQELHRSGAYSVAYLLDERQSAKDARESLAWVDAAVESGQVLDRLDYVPEVLCLTAWTTVYRGLTLPSRRKVYFVQDFEPSFYPVGVARHYADHTYNLGLPIFTLGPWLAGHLQEQGRPSRIAAMPFPFSDEVAPPAGAPRDLVSIYLQPDKMQRGSELLMETARVLAPELGRRFPGVELAFFGSRINDHIRFEFPCRVHGVLDPPSLRALLQRTRVGVSASFSNISLMPFRFLAAGAPAVDLDLPNVRINVPQEAQPVVRLAAPAGNDLAHCVLNLLDAAPPEAKVRLVAEQLHASCGWPACARAFAAFVGSL